MDIDFHKIMHGKEVPFNKCVGKTIKDSYILNYEGIICIIFTDNTFFYLEEYEDYDNIRSFEDTNVNYSNLKDYISFNKNGELYYHGIMEFMVKNGIFIESELKEYLLPLHKEELERQKERDIREYNRIKEMYNLK
jgi:hypothetical protein